MANFIETITAKQILSRVSYAGEYAMGLNGYIPDYLNGLNASRSGSNGIISSGMFLVDGKRVLINDGLNFTIPIEPVGTYKYDIYIVLNMASPDIINVVYSKQPSMPPNYRTDDLFLNYSTGVKFVKYGEATNSTVGVTSFTRTMDSAIQDTGWVDISEILNTANFTSTDLFARRIGKLVEIKGILDASKAHTTTTTSVQWTKNPSGLATQFLPSKAEKTVNIGSTFNRAWVELSTDGTGTIVRTTTNLASGHDIYINLRYTTD